MAHTIEVCDFLSNLHNRTFILLALVRQPSGHDLIFTKPDVSTQHTSIRLFKQIKGSLADIDAVLQLKGEAQSQPTDKGY